MNRILGGIALVLTGAVAVIVVLTMKVLEALAESDNEDADYDNVTWGSW